MAQGAFTALNTPSESNVERPAPHLSAQSHSFNLTVKFNSHDTPTSTKAYSSTLPSSPNRSTSSSLISNPDFPSPGPAHYAARRAMWLTPTKVPRRPPLSSSRQRLEQLLSEPGAVNSEEAWKDGIEKVWKGLVNGGRLKRSLPLNLMIKVIHAGWLRDPDTWPPGAVAPDSDQDPTADQPEPSCPVTILSSDLISHNINFEEGIAQVNASCLVTAATAKV